MLSCSLAVIVPVLNRPHRVEPTMRSIAASTPPGTATVFVADPDDIAELAELRRLDADVLEVAGNYATKVNVATRLVPAPLYFTGADDLDFEPGWLDAVRVALVTGAEVVGVNDLCNPRTIRGEHATQFVLTREAAALPTIDGKRGPLCELYRHNCVDDELIATARDREHYVFVAGAHVRHLHPMAGAAPVDETYTIGRRALAADKRIWRKRHRRFFGPASTRRREQRRARAAA